jgi:hypothetical protein
LASVGDPIYCRPPGAKLASATRGHRHPTKGAESSRIVIGFHRSPSVPGLLFTFYRLENIDVKEDNSFLNVMLTIFLDPTDWGTNSSQFQITFLNLNLVFSINVFKWFSVVIFQI